MKAIVYHQYGSPNVLKYQDVEMPVPKDDEVLIKVHAVSINSWDWDMVRGAPWIVRMWGLTKPKYKIPGADISGVVEGVGKKAIRFKVGDEVFGDLGEYGWGGFAEFVCAPEKILARKPKGITFEEAASIPQAGALALQGVRDRGRVKDGEHVLINGAGGGVGTFAIQLAKYFRAEVTAVDSEDKHTLMKRLGADHVIDFKKEDFTRQGRRYDLIVDVVSNRLPLSYKRALHPGGRVMMLGGTMSSIFSFMLFGKLLSMGSDKKLVMMGYKSNKDIDYIASLIETKVIVPFIENEFSLPETASAFRAFETGKSMGKIVVTI